MEGEGTSDGVQFGGVCFRSVRVLNVSFRWASVHHCLQAYGVRDVGGLGWEGVWIGFCIFFSHTCLFPRGRLVWMEVCEFRNNMSCLKLSLQHIRIPAPRITRRFHRLLSSPRPFATHLEHLHTVHLFQTVVLHNQLVR